MVTKYKPYFSEDWYESLKEYLESDKGLNTVISQINKDRINKTVIPFKGSDTFFRAFRETPLNQVKVVILGQDPYATIENGIPTFDGLAFSNKNSYNISPSLRNILKEVQNCYPENESIDPQDLTRWAKQGVLLLNTAHSVIANAPGSHIKLWELFTLYVVKSLNSKNDIVWLLMGNEAKRLHNLISNKTHGYVLTGHPSPLNKTVPFIGTNCFKNVNDELKARMIKEIIW